MYCEVSPSIKRITSYPLHDIIQLHRLAQVFAQIWQIGTKVILSQPTAIKLEHVRTSISNIVVFGPDGIQHLSKVVHGSGVDGADACSIFVGSPLFVPRLAGAIPDSSAEDLLDVDVEGGDDFIFDADRLDVVL